jgi:prevent-host-death family protein
MKEIPISKLKADFDKIVQSAHKAKRPVRITYRGKKVADILLRKPSTGVDGAK